MLTGILLYYKDILAWQSQQLNWYITWKYGCILASFLSTHNVPRSNVSSAKYKKTAHLRAPWPLATSHKWAWCQGALQPLLPTFCTPPNHQLVLRPTSSTRHASSAHGDCQVLLCISQVQRYINANYANKNVFCSSRTICNKVSTRQINAMDLILTYWLLEIWFQICTTSPLFKIFTYDMIGCMYRG